MEKEKKVSEVHKELFHYTNWEGLKGIWENGSLWATHYEHLNDSSEIKILKEKLPNYFFPYFHKMFLQNFKEASFSQKREMKKEGSVEQAAIRESEKLVDDLFKTGFVSIRSSPPVFVPYITSFCSHIMDQEYEKENGLLSQWRGYAKKGVSIVFDTKKLEILLKKYSEQYYFASLQFGDVVYANDEEEFNKRFGKVVEDLVLIGIIPLNEGQYWPDEVVSSFLSMCTRYKHQGFKEEREVRIISMPVIEYYYEKLISIDSSYEIKNKKLLHIHKRGENCEIPYLKLFGDQKVKKLPIKRIIIGPQEDQDGFAEEVRKLIDNPKIQIVCSKTPYISSEKE